MTKRPARKRNQPLFPLFQSTPPSFEEGLASVVDLLKGKKNVVVLTGAGISVSCGIPDFRSKHTGLYSTLDAEKLGLSCPEELFDYEVFIDNPRPFYHFAKQLYFPLAENERARPSDAHKLLAMLEENKMLLRVYSQNIDGLEQVAGVSQKRVVYAHGSLREATCVKCKHKVNAEDIEEYILKGTVARCQEPPKQVKQPVKSTTASVLSSRQPSARAKKKPRIDDGFDESTMCCGVLKPCVTFFGETLHDNVRRSLETDHSKADALIVIGTSLSVAPISKVIGYLPPNIPRILINRTIAHPAEQHDEQNAADNERDPRENYVFDAYLLGFCDDVARVLAKQLFFDSTQPPETYKEGKLLSAIKEDDEHYSLDDWASCSIPNDRIFLFPGAQPPSNDDDSVLTYREVAQCDGCDQRIVGMVQKCAICFDYDLCVKCFPSLHKKHGDGKHDFVEERVADHTDS